jgi:hypothetical protein
MSDKYDQLQERYHDFTKALEDYVVSSIPLLKAAEVLAKYICVADSIYTNHEEVWEMESEDDKQKYIQRAIDELKK